MVAGKPDYWQSNYPSKVLFGSGQSQWYIQDGADVAGGSTADLCHYIVPDKHNLVLGYLAMTCNGPGTQKASLLVNDVIMVFRYFDIIIAFSLPDTSLYVFPAGYNIKARVYNFDDVTWHFSVGGIGFLTQI